MSAPIDQILAALRARGDVTPRGKGWRCLCPAHADTNPSLDVDTGTDGRVLLCCRSRGCSAASIAAAIGLTMRHLFNGTMPEKLDFDSRVLKVYDYTDELGNLLYQTVRLWDHARGKDFRQRRPDGKGGWVWNLQDTRRVLYRLPELLAADPSATVYVAEGEKDVDALVRLGLVATTNPMGAGKWRKDYAEFLRGRNVVVLPDNDEPGRAHGATVAASLKGVAAVVQVVELPDLPPKGDVSDWLAAGGTAAKLAEIVSCGKLPQENGTLKPSSCVIPTVGMTTDADENDAPQTGAQIILTYLRDRYRPDFRRGNAVHTADGEMLTMAVACGVPNSVLIGRLANAANAPTFKGGGVNRDQLPAFFKKWAPVAWGDLLEELDDELNAKLGGDSAAGEEFRRLVRDAMLSEVVLGDTIEDSKVTQTQRCSLIDWCVKFAKPGPWRAIRSKKVWCKAFDLTGGEIILRVAVRVELFAQLRADKRLCSMTQNEFTRLAERYGVGSSNRDDRPHGLTAVVLNDQFVETLTAGLSDPEIEDPNLVNDFAGAHDAEGNQIPEGQNEA